ncbi:MAG: hypothetical protein ACYCXN_16245 [Acidimicrobiales bacterium]
MSLPDNLLQAVHNEAKRRGTTRSGLLRELAHKALSEKSTTCARHTAEIDRGRRPAKGRGGGVADLVKENGP